MDYIIDLYQSNPIAFISMVIAALGVIAAWVALYQKKKSKSEVKIGSETTVRTRNVGRDVIVQTGGVGNTEELANSNLAEEDKRDEWKIYEVAFLWHGKEPPGTVSHFVKMTREIENTKEKLHDAVNKGQLTISREIKYSDGSLTRYATRKDLRSFAESIDQYPAFLFPEKR